MANPRRLIYLSIAASLLTLAIKSAAYLITDSVGMLSDALESLVNLAAALTAWGALWYSSRPVDRDHTYGHEKIEFFSSGLEGVLILLAAASIGWQAIQRLLHPRELEALEIGGALALVASVLNFVVAQILIRAGRREHSIVLEADGKHLMTDVWTSIGVVAGLFLAAVTGWNILDPLIALAMAANIVWTALDLILRSFHGLMDHALPTEEQNKVRAAIEACMRPELHFHALRTRQAGARRFVDFHLLVPGGWTVQAAHDLADTIEQSIRDALPHAEVTVHFEPIEAQASWHDSKLLDIEAER